MWSDRDTMRARWWHLLRLSLGYVRDTAWQRFQRTLQRECLPGTVVRVWHDRTPLGVRTSHMPPPPPVPAATSRPQLECLTICVDCSLAQPSGQTSRQNEPGICVFRTIRPCTSADIPASTPAAPAACHEPAAWPQCSEERLQTPRRDSSLCAPSFCLLLLSLALELTAPSSHHCCQLAVLLQLPQLIFSLLHSLYCLTVLPGQLHKAGAHCSILLQFHGCLQAGA